MCVVPTWARSLALVVGAFSVATGGCVIGEEGALPDQPTPPPTPDAPPASERGLVREPTHGSLIAGDPSVISIRVAGEYSVADRKLAVQLLANPDDLTSWTTVTTVTTEPNGAAGARFATSVRPVASSAELVRWPRGGVLRLRVLDEEGDALPHDASMPDDTVLAVANPADLPNTWQYLTEKPVGSTDETLAYYATIDAPPTLAAFMTRYGFPGDEINARYYNVGDLGIGREMHCRATTAPAGGVACYVRNYGTFGGNPDVALAATLAGGIPLATVAMVYTPPITAPNSVSFIVYGPNDALLNEAQLDTTGNNTSIPQNCLNCHGGRSTYDAATNSVRGARFLPFDPAAFDFASPATFAAQDESFRRLNRLVATAAPTPAVRELIEGIYPVNNSPYDPGFVPAGWSASTADRKVYSEVIAPYCRGCHVSFSEPNDPLAFTTADSLRVRSADAMKRLCGEGPRGMPSAEQTTLHFFNSPARAVLLPWLAQAGACAPL